MRRHTLIARFGSEDKDPIKPFWSDALVTDVECLDLTQKFQHGLGKALEDLSSLGLQPKEAGFDLALLAATVFGADTRIPRGSESQDGWTREIEINLPVSDPILWGKATLLLQRALKFLTGDLWHFSFRARPTVFASICKTVQPELREFTCVSLFSGGMDSYIGALDLLGKGQVPLFVSHYLSHTSKNQTLCRDHLKKRFPETGAEFFRARVGFEKTMIPVLAAEANYDGENTERSRSFLFFSLAAMAAGSFGKPTKVWVPENGLIALNVPLDRLRIGALSTRTTHPFFIARINELMQVLGLRVVFENPYRFSTKGEMARDCFDADFLHQTVKDTASCSSLGKSRWLKLPAGHCGYCMPCLIRRAAMKAAFATDDTSYTLELGGTLNSKEAAGNHVRSFQVALERMKRSKNYAAAAVRIPGPLDDCNKEVPELTEVYRRGMNEVADLIQGVNTRPL